MRKLKFTIYHLESNMTIPTTIEIDQLTKLLSEAHFVITEQHGGDSDFIYTVFENHAYEEESDNDIITLKIVNKQNDDDDTIEFRKSENPECSLTLYSSTDTFSVNIVDTNGDEWDIMLLSFMNYNTQLSGNN